MFKFLKESYLELVYEVSWEKMSVLQRFSRYVVVYSILLSIAVGLVDYGIKFVLSRFFV